MKKYILLLLVVFSLLNASCFEDRDDVLNQASTNQINNFIWRGLNYYYLYKSATPELANDAFSDDASFNNFLNEFNTPEAFFEYLKANQDQFSILVDNYIELEELLAGTTKNNGMEYGLVRYPDQSENVFGYVRYVLPNTDAAAKGITRGIIFNTVNGTQITTSNFNSLFSPETYTIGLANLSNNTVNPTGETIELTKQVYTENPILVSQTLNIDNQNIGYLCYNGFTSQFDSQLNAVFGQFKANNITDLVLDLRYNGGGSVRTATYLASMITGQFTGDVFYTEQWNEDRQNLAENGLFLNSFVNDGEAINSLNLNRVYVLTTGSTASASELVINGLAPYIEVIQIGENTRGKYQASFLLYDAPAPNFSRSQANPEHTYAMLPLVFQTANAAGFTNYDDGLIPDITLGENFENLGILGNPTEPLLASALAQIGGFPAPVLGPTQWFEEIGDRKSTSKIHQIMYLSND